MILSIPSVMALDFLDSSKSSSTISEWIQENKELPSWTKNPDGTFSILVYCNDPNCKSFLDRNRFPIQEKHYGGYEISVTKEKMNLLHQYKDIKFFDVVSPPAEPQKRWIFNYISDGENAIGAPNLSNSVYILEMSNATEDEITNVVSTLLNNTKN